ncbi:MAG: H-NS histone family protein [bacterium]
MAKSMDMNNLTQSLEQFDTSELKEISNTALAIIESRKASEQREALEAIKQLASQHGLVVDVKAESGKGSKGRIPLPPLYRNPENPEQTWSGRGARPKWFKAALEAGKTADSMKIK